MLFECNTSKHLYHNEKKLITNYEKLYKKSLQNSNKLATMNIENFAKEYEKEQKMPESVRGNTPWIKKLYSEIESRPITSTFGTQRKDKLLSDFAKEAESIYKLDAKNRELPTIKEYMQKKYNFTAPKTSEIKTSNEPLKKDGSVTESLLNRKSVIGQNYDIHKGALNMVDETVPGVNYNKKPTTYELPFGNEENTKAFGESSITYTNYASKGETSRNKTNSIIYQAPYVNFDYDTTLSSSQEYNGNVEILQNRLVELGYLDMSEGGWGYFGPKTIAAVNAYKEDNDLGNDGKYNGVVGKETWKSLGLICREQRDIDAGVEIVIRDGKQYFDVSIPVQNALERDEKEFEKVLKAQTLGLQAYYLLWFVKTVFNNGKWNIKNNDKNTWEKTLKISSDTYYGTMIFNGRFVTAEELGNITFGYLGTAAGFPEAILKAGSFGYHVYDKKFEAFDEEKLANEYADHDMISIGAELYRQTH